MDWTLLCSSSSEYDIPVFEKSGKGGTYPRRYGVPFSLQDYSDGKTVLQSKCTLYLLLRFLMHCTSFLCHFSTFYFCSFDCITQKHAAPICSGRNSWTLCFVCNCQGGKRSPGLDEPKSMGSAPLSASAPPSSRPAPAAAAASSPRTWRRPLVPPAGPGEAATSSLAPWLQQRRQPQPCPSWTSAHPVVVSLSVQSPTEVKGPAFCWCRLNNMCLFQRRELQPTGGWGSCWAKAPSDESSSAMTLTRDENWLSNKSSLTQRVPRPAR